MNGTVLIAALALAASATCVPVGGVLADQVEEDAALAEQLLERGRKAEKIAKWAWRRAELAIKNSPTVVAEVAACRERADALPDGDMKKRTTRTCDRMTRKEVLLDSYGDELRELAMLFMIERLQEERARMEKDQFDALRRQLETMDGSTI